MTFGRNGWRGFNENYQFSFFSAVLLISGFEMTSDSLTAARKVLALHIGISTEKDIHTVFSPAEAESPVYVPGSKVVYYQVKGGRLRVSYSLCPDNNADSGKLPEGIIRSLSLYLSKPVKLSKLGIKTDVLKKTPEEDTDNIYFSDNEKGIIYVVNNNRLTSIEIFASRHLQ